MHLLIIQKLNKNMCMERFVVLFLIELIPSLQMFGNNKDVDVLNLDYLDNKVDTIVLSKATSDSVDNNTINDALLISINSLKKENSRLVNDNKCLRSDTAELRNRSRIYLRKIDELNDKIKEQELTTNQYRSKYEKLITDISKMDAVIYKQCLLYPLEGRYDSLLIRESLHAIQSFYAIIKNPSKEFTEYKATYEPLLYKYNQYNTQLHYFFEKELRVIKATAGVVSEAHKNKFKNELEMLPYYSECYVNRNKPPYKSILYLDELIDSFLAILEKKGNVLNDMDELLNKFNK